MTIRYGFIIRLKRRDVITAVISCKVKEYMVGVGMRGRKRLVKLL
jgi:hypothetical protein